MTLKEARARRINVRVPRPTYSYGGERFYVREFAVTGLMARFGKIISQVLKSVPVDLSYLG